MAKMLTQTDHVVGERVGVTTRPEGARAVGRIVSWDEKELMIRPYRGTNKIFVPENIASVISFDR